jgi:The  BURPS668_1122 family of deaminases
MMMRSQKVKYGTWCAVTCSVLNSANEKYNLIKDESYTLIDSFYQDNLYKAVSPIVAPFNVAETPTQPLEAPVEALSTTLQIDLMDIVAPSEATPTTPGESIEDITPPADAEAVAEPETSEDASGDVATSETGITTLMTGKAISSVQENNPSAVTNENVPAGSDLANGSTANPVVNSDATVPGQTELLATPTSALPESLGSVSTEDIAAPETMPTTGFSAPSAPTVADVIPDEVVSPDANVAPPNVGATAQDGPLDVVMPEELTASVPSVGGDVPAPIETVTPPVGWTPDNTDVGVFQTGSAEACAGIANGIKYAECTNTPNNVNEDAQKKLEEIKNRLGDLDDEERSWAVAEAVSIIAHLSDLQPSQLQGLFNNLDLLDPSEQVEYIDSFQNALSTGQMDRAALESYSAALEDLEPGYARAYLEDIKTLMDSGTEMRGKTWGDNSWVRAMYPTFKQVYGYLGAWLFSVGQLGSVEPVPITGLAITDSLAVRAAAIRAEVEGIAPELAGGGNVSLLRLNIPGSELPIELKAFSGFGNPGESYSTVDGFVSQLSEGSQIFRPVAVNRLGEVGKGDPGFRARDGEIKLLNEAARRLSDNPSVSGRIEVYSERYVCLSCGSAILKFRQVYPNIDVRVFIGGRE